MTPRPSDTLAKSRQPCLVSDMAGPGPLCTAMHAPPCAARLPRHRHNIGLSRGCLHSRCGCEMAPIETAATWSARTQRQTRCRSAAPALQAKAVSLFPDAIINHKLTELGSAMLLGSSFVHCQGADLCTLSGRLQIKRLKRVSRNKQQQRFWGLDRTMCKVM